MSADLSSNFVCSVLLYPTLSIDFVDIFNLYIKTHFAKKMLGSGHFRRPGSCFSIFGTGPMAGGTQGAQWQWVGGSHGQMPQRYHRGCCEKGRQWQVACVLLHPGSIGRNWMNMWMVLHGICIDCFCWIGHLWLEIIRRYRSYCHLFFLLTGWIFCLCCNLASCDDIWEALDLRNEEDGNFDKTFSFYLRVVNICSQSLWTPIIKSKPCTTTLFA